ncbi:DUF2818 family protein [Sphaerotilus uruguayifluvii]|uniref:DUF2818 family protein n=1 Tax=Sphaerotilus uruguayifluvii TaxID=2735897 RepID=A0ABX2G7N8_9BURK|nr:hypothetical protein [Leptothrix sp. C29]
MISSASVWLVLLLAAVLANLPFLNERLFAFGPRREPKGVAWRLVELMLYTGVVIGIGRALEASGSQAAPQGWQFYAVLLCMMLTLAFPGFVWRYLRRHR